MLTTTNTQKSINLAPKSTLFSDINDNYSALHNIQPTTTTVKHDYFLLWIEPDLAAPGRCEFTITSCSLYKDILTEESGLESLIVITFDIKDVDGQHYQVVERFFDFKPQQTQGRIFDFFSDLFKALGIEGGIDSEELIGRTGFATLQYLPSDDGTLSWGRLSDFSTNK
ncbi:hypothetical protein LNN31_16475 [Acetobacterium wieringae]|uniref:Uncharacterized protein n=1 Tax=Acetobacterium wieringae TaxID=52694 RepID=A0ABY6HD32_9FIRM|nr:hypothetical protein [Acetobacterium wieringae]UYO62365.1 hypothetical protein LNN31_16475 [Acetobacterium wieringae]VUZ22983.1 Uncharacterised protein [Acetobacterium wieringae]